MPDCWRQVYLEASLTAWYFFLVALWPSDDSSYPPLLLSHRPTGKAVSAKPISGTCLRQIMVQQGWLKHPGVSHCLAGTRKLSQIANRANALTSSWWLLWITFCSLTMDTGHQMCFFIYLKSRKELAHQSDAHCRVDCPSCPAVLIKSLQQPHPLVEGSLPMCFGLIRRYQDPYLSVLPQV